MHIKSLTLASLSVLALMSSTAMADPFRLILTHLEPPLVPNSVMDLAKELGYFEREGVDVELVRVQQTPSAIAALQAGEGEMANIGVDALLQLTAQGASDLIAVTSPNKSLPYLIAAKSEIATVADMKGRSFGVGRVGSLDYSLSMKVFEAAGLDTSTLEILTLGQPNVRGQALAAGQVDATTMSVGVWLSLPERDGLSVLVDQADYYAAASVVNKVNVVPAKVLEERRADVIAVITALTKLSRDFNADPAKWVDAMQAYKGNLSDADLAYLADSFKGSWSVNGGFSVPELQATQDYLYTTEDFAGVAPVTLDQWTDFTVMDEVLAAIGVDDSGDTPAR